MRRPVLSSFVLLTAVAVASVGTAAAQNNVFVTAADSLQRLCNTTWLEARVLPHTTLPLGQSIVDTAAWAPFASSVRVVSGCASSVRLAPESATGSSVLDACVCRGYALRAAASRQLFLRPHCGALQ
jgi:hypothetical protein